jgi:hypothetical protein
MAAAVLTLLLAWIVFLATKEMFGTGAAFIALTLLVFDPNLLAHGALVTTDAALSCLCFQRLTHSIATVKAPSVWRLSVVRTCDKVLRSLQNTLARLSCHAVTCCRFRRSSALLNHGRS